MGLGDNAASLNQPMPAGLPVDNEWAGQMAGIATTQEQAPKTSDQTVPSFPYYVVHFNFGRGSVTKNQNFPVARVGCQIKEGPDGTVGETVFDDIFLMVSKFTEDNGVRVEKDKADYDAGVAFLNALLKKVARVGKFAVEDPTTFPGGVKEKAEAYAAQFGANGGFDAIVEISEQSSTYQGNTTIKNRIKFAGMRALDEPAHLKRSKPGSSALDEAREKIAERNKAITAKAGGDGRTLGSIGRKGISG